MTPPSSATLAGQRLAGGQGQERALGKEGRSLIPAVRQNVTASSGKGLDRTRRAERNDTQLKLVTSFCANVTMPPLTSGFPSPGSPADGLGTAA